MYVDTQTYIDIDDRTEAKLLIKKAHRLLQANGWAQGAFSIGSSHCIVGALLAAAEVPISDFHPTLFLPKDVATAVNLLGAVIGLKDSPHIPLVQLVEMWNDAPLRTKRQVMAAMRKAAA